MHQFFPLSWKNKYFEATSHIYFTMCTRSRLKYFLIDLIYSALFFPSLANFLIYFLILVRFKPDLLIKPIVIKKECSLFYKQYWIYQRAQPGIQSVQQLSGLCNWFLCLLFSVLCLSVLCSPPNFSILLQYNIRLLPWASVRVTLTK